MSLKIIRGRSKSGKSAFMLEDMNFGENSIYIVPEQFSFSAEKKLIDKFGVSGLGNPQVVSFNRLADTIIPEFAGESFVSDNSSFEMLISYCANNLNSKDLRLFDGLVKKSQFSETASSIIKTFRKYSITVPMLESAILGTDDSFLKKKLTDCTLIYKEYLKSLEDAGTLDLHGKLSALTDILKSGKCDYFKNKAVYIDQFSAFDPSELSCIKEIMRLSPRVCVSLCIDDEADFPTVFDTYNRLLSFAKEINIKIEAEEILNTPMAGASPMLRYLEKNYISESPTPLSGTDGSISIHCAENKISEINYVARKIFKFVRERNLRYRDISVVARNIEDYKDIIARVFPMYNIPVFVDKKISLSSHSITMFITSILDISISGFKYENVFSFAKSPFSPISFKDADMLENYCLAAGIRPYSWSKPFFQKVGTYKGANSFLSEEDELSYLNELREKIYSPLSVFSKKAQNAENVNEICSLLFELFEALSLEEKINESAEFLQKEGENLSSMQTSQVYNVLIGIFDNISFILGEKKLSLKEFASVISSGLKSVEIGTIPVSLDCVSVGSIDRIKGHESKAVMLVGVNADVFPAPPKDEGLFSDYEKEELLSFGIEMPPNLLRKSQSENLLVYDALTCASDMLFISYARTNSDQSALMPSEIIENIQYIFPDISFTDDIEEENDLDMISSEKAVFDMLIVKLFKAIYEGETLSPEMSGAAYYFSKSEKYAPLLNEAVRMMNYTNEPKEVPIELIEKFVGSDMKTSISKLETYNKCPFSFLAQYLLKLEPRKYFEIKASDTGSFLHDFLEAFSKIMEKEKHSWKDIDDSFIRENTKKVLSEIFGAINSSMLEVPRIKALFTRLSRVAEKCVYTVKRHISHGDFIPLGYEVSFDDNGNFKPIKIKLDNNKTVTLQGRIDRADEFLAQMPDGSSGKFVRIIDYKSSDKTLDLSKVYNGISLQLFAYLSTMCENGYKPAGILYCNLSDNYVSVSPDATEEEILSEKENKSRMNGIILSDETIKGHMGGKSVIKSSKELSFEDFDAMFSHISKTIKKTVSDIYKGKFNITCSKDNCDWCNFKSLCRYDVSFDGFSEADYPKYTDDEILSLIKGGAIDEMD